jgi:hypothetical protein
MYCHFSKRIAVRVVAKRKEIYVKLMVVYACGVPVPVHLQGASIRSYT